MNLAIISAGMKESSRKGDWLEMMPSEITWPLPQPRLETSRLFLRPLVLSDAKALQALAGDFAISDTTLNIAHPYPDGLAEEWIATHLDKYKRKETVIFGILLKENEALAGVVGLIVNEKFQQGDLGYWIGVPFWNRGYATEAARALVQFGFNHLALHKIEANHFARNPASGKVMKKIGFLQEGFRRDHVKKGDHFEDVVTYGLLKSN